MKKKRVNEPYEISTRTGSDVFNYRHWKNKLRTNKRGGKKNKRKGKERKVGEPVQEIHGTSANGE